VSRRGKPRFTADGVLVVNKPAGPTSHDLVARLRRRFKPAKLGHAGTLDPFASGVLVMAFNQMTRLVELLGQGDKVYRGRVSLGAATDTGDPTGQITARAPVPELGREAVEAALAGLVGERLQSPPAYSAAKHKGKPLYAYARQGEKVAKPPKPIKVAAAELTELGSAELGFAMTVSRGTYVRSLAEDLARALGTVGHLAVLERTASQPFEVGEAVELDDALAMGPAELGEAMLDSSRALARCGLSSVTVDEDTAWRLRQGMILTQKELMEAGAGEPGPGRAFRVLERDGGLVAVLRWVDPAQNRAGRDYETVRVFPLAAEPAAGDQASASAMGAE